MLDGAQISLCRERGTLGDMYSTVTRAMDASSHRPVSCSRSDAACSIPLPRQLVRLGMLKNAGHEDVEPENAALYSNLFAGVKNADVKMLHSIAGGGKCEKWSVWKSIIHKYTHFVGLYRYFFLTEWEFSSVHECPTE